MSIRASVEMTAEQEHAYIVSILRKQGWPRLEAIEEADRLKRRVTGEQFNEDHR